MEFKLPKRIETFVKNEIAQTKTFSHTRPNEMIYLLGCKDGNYKVEGKVSKIILEKCSKVNINVNSDVMSGTMEIISCDGCKITVSKLIPTMVIEKSKKCDFLVSKTWGRRKGQGTLYSTNDCEEIRILVDDVIYPITYDQEQVKKVHSIEESSNQKPLAQFVSKFINNEMHTEIVIREGAGYATTPTEKAAADKKQEENQRKIEEIMAKGIELLDKQIQKQKEEKQKSEEAVKEVKPQPKGLLKDIASFNKTKLNHTETHVTTTPVIKPPQTSYSHAPGEDITEYYDTPEDLLLKVKELAKVIKESKHMVAYTGAGVSTSAKIPDYRGPQGVWTLRDQGKSPKMEITLEQALPTPTHMAIVELEKQGMMKYLVSTNVDGLHRRAGTSENMMAELHGNSYREICETCGQEYLMPFAVHGGFNHRTGRKCEMNGCDGFRKDTIINFGENLPKRELDLTTLHAKKSDLALVLGTSMQVQPACIFPSYALKNGGKMVIVNLQKTPFDSSAHLIIREKTDKVMELLFKELNLSIPNYTQKDDIIHQLKQGQL